MFDRKDVTLMDLVSADSLDEFWRLWERYEAEPALMLGLLVVAILLWAKFIAVSPLDQRDPQRGTFYLGNIRLGRNPKADGGGPTRTRLGHDPDYDEDDPLK